MKTNKTSLIETAIDYTFEVATAFFAFMVFVGVLVAVCK